MCQVVIAPNGELASQEEEGEEGEEEEEEWVDGVVEEQLIIESEEEEEEGVGEGEEEEVQAELEYLSLQSRQFLKVRLWKCEPYIESK